MDLFAPALHQADRIRRREVTSAELTQAYLDRIEKINPVLNAYVLTTPEVALEQARAAARRRLGRAPDRRSAGRSAAR